MTTLTTLRADLRKTLNAPDDTTTWPNDTVDEAFRLALRDYADRGPILEASLTVATSGYEQDLGSVTGFYRLVSLAWPWDDDGDFNRLAVRWRAIDADTVRIQDGEPQSGEVLRLRYRRLYAIEDLDSAASTTIPANDERIVVLAAAWRACELRVLALSEDPSAAKTAIPALRYMAGRFETDFAAALRGVLAPGPNWGSIGL